MKNALGVSLGITALIWTYLALNVIPGVLVWAGFIAWGAYFTVGKTHYLKPYPLLSSVGLWQQLLWELLHS